MAYFAYWKDTQGSDFPDDKCLVVKLGPEMCDLSDDMRSVLRTGTDAIIQRITRCTEHGQADGSITTTVPATELGEALYQLWLGASLLAKLNDSTAAFDTALAASRRLLA